MKKKDEETEKGTPAQKNELKAKAETKVEPNPAVTTKTEPKVKEQTVKKETVKKDKAHETFVSEISSLKEKIEKITSEIDDIKKQLTSEQKTNKEEMIIKKEVVKPRPKEELTPKEESITTITNEKTDTTMEEMDYKKVDDFINSQSRLNKWYDRKIEYTGNQTSILCGDIPIIREWESGKSKKAIAFSRLENRLGLVQLQNDGVIGVHLSPMFDEGFGLHENQVLIDKIKDVLERAKFKESEVIMALGGGLGFDWQEIIKLLADKYTIQLIENNKLKRKWFVEVINQNADENANNKDKTESLRFTPIGQ